MSFRIENKYEISSQKLNLFYDFLRSHNGKRIYEDRLINSIYFDNNNKDSFFDSEEGTVPRKKIRLRYYGSENLSEYKKVFFETKINSYDGKYKISKTLNDYNKLIKFGIDDDFYGFCKPIVRISYQREYHMIDKFRLTLDKKIRYSKFFRKKFFTDLGSYIVEIKTNELDTENEINQLFPFKKIRYSKYANSINLLKLNNKI